MKSFLFCLLFLPVSGTSEGACANSGFKAQPVYFGTEPHCSFQRHKKADASYPRLILAPSYRRLYAWTNVGGRKGTSEDACANSGFKAQPVCFGTDTPRYNPRPHIRASVGYLLPFHNIIESLIVSGTSEGACANSYAK